MMILSKPTLILRVARRFNSAEPLKFKFPPKEDVERAKEVGFFPPAWHHSDNPYYKPHVPSENWVKVFYMAIPFIIVSAVYSFYHSWEEEKHVMEIRPEFKPYEHLRIIRTPFPWGDGKHGLFHNPKRNALPDGYEV